jgi:hypothetical protein
MWTNWHFPNQLNQLETTQIDYTDGSGILDHPRDIVTVKPVVGNATSNGSLVLKEANSVVFKSYGFAVDSSLVTSVEIQLSVARVSRIQDRAIQLYMNEPIGENLADVTAGDIHVYTSPAIVGVDYNSVNFGCVIDLAPHRLIPSNNSIIIRTVGIRLLLA